MGGQVGRHRRDSRQQGSSLLPYFQVCKAMSSYRLARYADAVSWAEKALDSSPAYASAHACAVLAMAHWQLGRQADARAMLIKEKPWRRTSPLSAASKSSAVAWVAWLIARIALDEARAISSPNRRKKREQTVTRMSLSLAATVQSSYANMSDATVLLAAVEQGDPKAADHCSISFTKNCGDWRLQNGPGSPGSNAPAHRAGPRSLVETRWRG